MTLNVKYGTALQLAPAKAIVSLLQLELRNLPFEVLIAFVGGLAFEGVF